MGKAKTDNEPEKVKSKIISYFIKYKNSKPLYDALDKDFRSLNQNTSTNIYIYSLIEILIQPEYKSSLPVDWQKQLFILLIHKDFTILKHDGWSAKQIAQMKEEYFSIMQGKAFSLTMATLDRIEATLDKGTSAVASTPKGLSSPMAANGITPTPGLKAPGITIASEQAPEPEEVRELDITFLTNDLLKFWNEQIEKFKINIQIKNIEERIEKLENPEKPGFSLLTEILLSAFISGATLGAAGAMFSASITQILKITETKLSSVSKAGVSSFFSGLYTKGFQGIIDGYKKVYSSKSDKAGKDGKLDLFSFIDYLIVFAILTQEAMLKKMSLKQKSKEFNIISENYRNLFLGKPVIQEWLEVIYQYNSVITMIRFDTFFFKSNPKNNNVIIFSGLFENLPWLNQIRIPTSTETILKDVLDHLAELPHSRSIVILDHKEQDISNGSIWDFVLYIDGPANRSREVMNSHLMRGVIDSDSKLLDYFQINYNFFRSGLYDKETFFWVVECLTSVNGTIKIRYWYICHCHPYFVTQVNKLYYKQKQKVAEMLDPLGENKYQFESGNLSEFKKGEAEYPKLKESFKRIENLKLVI